MPSWRGPVMTRMRASSTAPVPFSIVELPNRAGACQVAAAVVPRLPLDAAGRQTTDEIALKEEEEHGRRQRDDDAAGRQHAPVDRELAKGGLQGERKGAHLGR